MKYLLRCIECDKKVYSILSTKEYNKIHAGVDKLHCPKCNKSSTFKGLPMGSPIHHNKPPESTPTQRR